MEETKTTGGSYFKKDQIEIHTMPKRYLGSSKGSSTQAKSTGFLILASGAILLCVIFVVLYFYYSRSEEEPLASQNNTVNEVIPAKEETEAEQEGSGLEQENINNSEEDNYSDYDYYDDYADDFAVDEDVDDEDILSATSSEPATSSPETEISTSTKKIVIEPETATATPVVYKTATDSDGDGLGDIEELLLDCNLGAQDSDGDGYDDLSELLSLYNPAGGGKIIVNPNIERYINQTYNYSLYYPNIWILKTVGGDEALLFQISTDQFIQVAVEPNAEGETIEDWYQEQFGSGYIPTDQRLNKEGWTGIKNPDGLVVYLNHPGSDKIFAISYSPGADGVINYKNVFDMIVNSLELN